MNSLSKQAALAALLFLALPGFSRGDAQTDRLFTAVSDQDPVWAQLSKLASAGLLESADVKAPLTRYEVARRIVKAQDKYDQIVVALADVDIPPPPDEGTVLPEAGGSEPSAAASAPSAEETETPEVEVSLEDAAATLHSLEEAYQYEIKILRDRLSKLAGRMDDLEAQQYATRKKLMSLLFAPKVAIHGLGRAFGLSQHEDGFGSPIPSDVRSLRAYLDLCPEGMVSKEVAWFGSFRFQSTFEPDTNQQIVVRRIGMTFNPPWMSVSLGDFFESYTPLTLWNRDNLDLQYKPEMWARQDATQKYESYFDHDPAWPFRGLKLGTAVDWPDSKILEGASASAFAHMIRNGFDDNNTVNSSGGWYFGPHQWMDWVFAGTYGLKSSKWWVGEKYLQLSLNGYGSILDTALGTDTPGSSYDPQQPSTWAHRYMVGSTKPDLKMEWGNGRAVGAAAEYAYSRYLDDERDPLKTVSDFALLGGPYVKFGDSKISLQYLDVGPYYYSPLAQTRQDAVTSVAALPPSNSPDMVQFPLHSENFLTGLSRPGGMFTYYDRTQDNTFPYGLATPNRRGLGGDVDLKAFENDVFKLKGSAYWVQQITGDLVFNQAETAFVPVDDPDGTIPVPLRKFMYVNVGPSYNFGPALHFDRDLELGANVRMERTDSSLGRLNSSWVVGALRAAILRFWQITTAYSQQKADGTESGYDGTTWAGYSYLYDNGDLGHYSAVSVDQNIRSARVSNLFHLNAHADLFLDYAWTDDRSWSVVGEETRQIKQYVGMTYEVRF